MDVSTDTNKTVRTSPDRPHDCSRPSEPRYPGPDKAKKEG
jgi:hypothetical protein